MTEPGECSALCGPGEAKRNVSCVRPENGQDTEVDHSFCSNQLRPLDFVPCVVHVCPIGWESTAEVKWQTRRRGMLEPALYMTYFFLDQDLPVQKSGLLPHVGHVPVYVWSPIISQCSKTCGNGK